MPQRLDKLSKLPSSLTLTPIPDESLTGFIFRLANHRRLPSARALAAACGFDRFTDQPEREWIEALAETASVDVQTLAEISKGPPDSRYGWWRGQRFSRGLLDRRGAAARRMCPRCVADTEYHRAIWDIKYIAVCPIHRSLLLDECPGCGDPLGWRGRSLVLCRCGMDLRACDSPRVADREAEVTGAVFGLLGDPDFQSEAAQVQAMPPFQDLLGSDITEFLFRLGLERLGRHRKKAFSTDHLGELAWEAHVALRLGLEAVATAWPESFLQEIDAMRDRWGGNTRITLFRCVGAIEFWLSHLQEGSHGTAIAASLIAYRRRDALRRGLPEPPPAVRRKW